jgi:hypothetical protein
MSIEDPPTKTSEDGEDPPAGASEEGGGNEEEESSGGCAHCINRCGLKFAYLFDQWIAKRSNQFLLVLYLFFLSLAAWSPIFHIWQDEFFDPRYYNDSLQYENKMYLDSLWETYC